MSGIYWHGDTRLKTFSFRSKPKGGSVVSVEIDVKDSWALASIINQLEEIRAEQEAEARRMEMDRMQEAAERARKARAEARPKAIKAEQAPLLLGYSGPRDK